MAFEQSMYVNGEEAKTNRFPFFSLRELHKGIERNVDVEEFAKNDYNPLQIRSFIALKEKGIDIECLLNPEFSHKQIDILGLGLQHHLDISGLLNPNLEFSVMESEIMHGLSMKKDGHEKPSLDTLISQTKLKETVKDKNAANHTNMHKGEGNKNKELDISER